MRVRCYLTSSTCRRLLHLRCSTQMVDYWRLFKQINLAAKMAMLPLTALRLGLMPMRQPKLISFTQQQPVMSCSSLRQTLQRLIFETLG